MIWKNFNLWTLMVWSLGQFNELVNFSGIPFKLRAGQIVQNHPTQECSESKLGIYITWNLRSTRPFPTSKNSSLCHTLLPLLAPLSQQIKLQLQVSRDRNAGLTFDFLPLIAGAQVWAPVLWLSPNYCNTLTSFPTSAYSLFYYLSIVHCILEL